MNTASNSSTDVKALPRIGTGAVTGLCVGEKKRIIILDDDLLESAGFYVEGRITAEAMPDGSIVLRPIVTSKIPIVRENTFEAALQEANDRFGGAFQRLAK